MTMFNMLPLLILISKASFKWEGEMNPNLVASACTVQESFPFVRVWYLDMSIFQIPWSSFPIWFVFWRLPLLLIRAWWQFWERIEKNINSNPAKCMEGFVLPLVHFWTRLQVVAKQPYLILQHHSPSIPATPGEEAACVLVCSDEDNAHCSALCRFFPGNLKVKIETKRCLPPSRSPTSLPHGLKSKHGAKQLWQFPASCQSCCKQHAAPHAVNPLAQAPGWGGQPAPPSLAGSSTLGTAINCSRNSFQVTSIFIWDILTIQNYFYLTFSLPSCSLWMV